MNDEGIILPLVLSYRIKTTFMAIFIIHFAVIFDFFYKLVKYYWLLSYAKLLKNVY